MIRGRVPASLWLVLLGSLVLTTVLLWPKSVSAQCGSSASSCKNCHEVQAEHPVNDSGEWHTAHAFGDFCEFCHAGNVQATDKEAAHTGMEYPLENINASCLSCHPADVNERAEVYALALGVEVGSSGGGNNVGGDTSASEADSSAASDSVDNPPAEAAAEPAPASDGGAIVDFNRQYELTVLDERKPLNVGNVILTILLVAMTGLGAYLLWRWEGLGLKWQELRRVPAMAGASAGAAIAPPTPMPRATPAASAAPQPIQRVVAEEEDNKLAELLEKMQQVDPESLAALTRLLERPQQGWPIVRAVGRIDTRLVTAVHHLDAADRELLMAIVKEMDRE